MRSGPDIYVNSLNEVVHFRADWMFKLFEITVRAEVGRSTQQSRSLALVHPIGANVR